MENGTDIRFIQKLLGHKRLETTTIYTQLADARKQGYRSPLDDLPSVASPVKQTSREKVGKFSLLIHPTDCGRLHKVVVRI
ncbi:MAG: tyrosine-type recombinase/integrase, partial [Planctomycetota bacterium]